MMMPPNELREASATLDALVQGRDPMLNKPLPSRYPLGMNASMASHLSHVVQARVLRPVQRCHAWLEEKIAATPIADVDVALLEATVHALTEAATLLGVAAKDERNSLGVNVDRLLRELHALLRHYVS